MVRRARLLVCLALLVGACSVEESGAGPASGGAGGLGGGQTGGSSAGGAGGAGGVGGAGGTSLGGAGGSGGVVGGTAGMSNDAAVDAPSDTSPDVEDATDAAEAGDAAGDAPSDAGDGGLVTALDGARIELPCAGVTSSTACVASTYTKTFPFEGKLGVSYDVTLRFRGVVEENGYSCTTKTGSFCVGGSPTAAGWNVFSIKVADPAQVYYLNAGAAGVLHCWPIDYQATIPIKGSALIELLGDSIDSQQVRNFDGVGTPIVVSGVSPDPQAFNGQFIQIDVVSIQAN